MFTIATWLRLLFPYSLLFLLFLLSVAPPASSPPSPLFPLFFSMVTASPIADKSVVSLVCLSEFHPAFMFFSVYLKKREGEWNGCLKDGEATVGMCVCVCVCARACVGGKSAVPMCLVYGLCYHYGHGCCVCERERERDGIFNLRGCM